MSNESWRYLALAEAISAILDAKCELRSAKNADLQKMFDHFGYSRFALIELKGFRVIFC